MRYNKPLHFKEESRARNWPGFLFKSAGPTQSSCGVSDTLWPPLVLGALRRGLGLTAAQSADIPVCGLDVGNREDMGLVYRYTVPVNGWY